jgi:Carboxylesterase family
MDRGVPRAIFPQKSVTETVSVLDDRTYEPAISFRMFSFPGLSRPRLFCSAARARRLPKFGCHLAHSKERSSTRHREGPFSVCPMRVRPSASCAGNHPSRQSRGPARVRQRNSARSVGNFRPNGFPTLPARKIACTIWTPQLADQAKLPVIVFFHGGSNTAGYSQLTPLGPALSPLGVVVVTANYRLGALGFFAHPALTRESEHHSSGNYGLLDQLQELR